MFRVSCVMVLALGFAAHAHAQAPVMQGEPSVIVIQRPGEMAPAPQAVPAACLQKVCVSEVKKNTKVVYSSRCKEFCMPSCSIFSLFRGDCGCDGNCGEVWTRKVLVKKTVPDCDSTQCVLKEVPVTVMPCTPCPPCGR